MDHASCLIMHKAGLPVPFYLSLFSQMRCMPFFHLLYLRIFQNAKVKELRSWKPCSAAQAKPKRGPKGCVVENCWTQAQSELKHIQYYELVSLCSTIQML